jgi:phenylacetic acid degradation operon negative regulatory protein
LSTKTDPHTIIFSLFGQYVLPRGGKVWIGTLIRALAALDFSPGAVRALVSRMKRKGLMENRRVGRRSFYWLTDSALHQVQEGGSRAFAPSGDDWDECWTVATYSVPEEYRERRETLRRSLTWFRFGALAPSVWISPHPLPSDAENKWRNLGVWRYLDIFRAEYLGSSDMRSMVAHAWPHLPEIEERYRAYIARYGPLLRRFKAGRLDDEESFATRLRSLFEFVAITLRDPDLPPSLLPEDWSRPSAQLLFRELVSALNEPAERFFDAIYHSEEETNDEKAD